MGIEFNKFEGPLTTPRDGQNAMDGNLEKEREKRVKEIVKFRFNQTDGSKLAEYITGLRPDNPQMADRLFEDQKRIRVKYELPIWDTKYDPAEHERLLEDLARKYQISIRNILEFQGYFREEKNREVGGKQNDGQLVVSINRQNLQNYFNDLMQLEHEIVHAIQEIKFPRMPIELQEYEAYVACFNVKNFKDNPETIENFFDLFVRFSVEWWYDKNKKNRQNFEPKWKNPEFFLNNVDQISSEEIKKFKSTESLLKRLFGK